MDVQQVEVWFRECLEPEPILTVSEWADEHRILSSVSASEAGPWRTSRTPYLQEIMDVLSVTHPARKIVFKKGAQVGGTEAGNNWIGYIIDHAPGPTMMVLPRGEDAERNSKLRIDPLIAESPRLREKVANPKARDSNNTIKQKGFEGGQLVLTGANSVAGLKSMPARNLFLDEVDEYPHDLEGQGSPISLVMARSRTFSRRKAFLVSTPTIEGASIIDSEFKLSDRRFYHVPCPECGEFQKLSFSNLSYEIDENRKVTSIHYGCKECGFAIEEGSKTEMLKRGKWVAENPDSDVVGFHLNSLYSPVGWYSWKDIAEDFEEAKHDLEKNKKTEKMRTFVNTALGKTYKEEGDAPEWERLYHRRDDYVMGVVPTGGLFLTCGADIQKDRIECEVVAWGRNKISWSVDYRVFPGDTSQDEVWGDFENYIANTFEVEGTNLDLPIKLIAVDSGYNTQKVYNFCRKFPKSRVVPVKGSDNLSILVGTPKVVDVKINGKTYKRGVSYWPVGVSVLKKELYSFLNLEQPIGDAKFSDGFCHFPQYDEEYFKQLTAERELTKLNRKGYSVTEWVKDRERNEALDCRIYNRAAASIVGIDRYKEKDWERLERNMGVAKPLKTENNSGNTKNQKRVRKKRQSSFW